MSNTAWIWSQPYQRHYRYEFNNGVLQTIWGPNTTHVHTGAQDQAANTNGHHHHVDSIDPQQETYRPMPPIASFIAMPPVQQPQASPLYLQAPPASQMDQQPVEYGQRPITRYTQAINGEAQQLPGPYQQHGYLPIPVQGHTPLSPGRWSGLNSLPVPGGLQGMTVHGTYHPDTAQPGIHYEPLDPSYFVRTRSFFNVGKVFSILFTENAGSTVISYNKSISTVLHGEPVFTQVRRFIVVRDKNEFCFACPIFTYGKQGTLKSGVRANEHAVAYSYGQSVEFLPGESEKGLIKDPICIVGLPNVRPLDKASRIYFGIHHPIQYNVKVKDLGDVHRDHLLNLRRYWLLMQRDGTEQDIADTATG
ncbi:hypothetical protein K504DRAFT_456543 [Pleomassaria siparia CBS 279.74]|uniref:DUF6590 domain-containing protein n=1 Tax=Pleomassaria siparia CBS 279.74 TaxID=1314801 RepID=A0A6G1KNC5_9PLEO|nr:hypothetical protein K504DRAFT_456543 [Pleomassaria siparia CBS 279.74]